MARYLFSRYLFCSAIALSLLFGITPGFTQPKPASPTQTSSWQKFNSKEGRFQVLMPKMPDPQQQSFPLQGTKLKVQIFMFTAVETLSANDANNATGYSVAYADLPFIPTTAEAADALLEASQGQLLANNTLLARSSLQLKSNPGRELKLRDPKGMLSRVRLFMVKERIYVVMVFSNSEQGLAANSNRFLDSFELADK